MPEIINKIYEKITDIFMKFIKKCDEISEKILKKLDDELKKSKVKHKTQISYVDIEKNINKLKTLATICFNNDNK